MKGAILDKHLMSQMAATSSEVDSSGFVPDESTFDLFLAEEGLAEAATALLASWLAASGAKFDSL